MKKITRTLILLLLVLAVFIPVQANEQTPDYTQMSDIERLARGIIYIPDTMTLEDFYETMKIVDDSDRHINSDKFMYFCYTIEELYYVPITAEELFRSFAKNNPYVDINDFDKVYRDLFAELDRYSYYLSAEQSEKFWNPTQATGVGLTFVYDATGEAWGQVGTYVEGVSAGSSAEAAGILAGDRLVELMGIDTSEMTFAGVSAILSSLTDEAYVDLKYERITEDEIIIGDVTLERRTTNFREVTFHLYPEKRAFMVSITSFGDRRTHVELIDRFKKLKEAGYVNAIVDLRNNSGGDVEVAANIIGAFLDEERVLFTMGREGNKNYYVFKSSGIGVKFDSLHVLVNENTASSAEITALCLQQHAGAVLVGQRTVGKAVAQSAGQIIDGSTFGITTFVAYDYNGNTYNEKGLLPRLFVKNESFKYDFPTDLEWFNYINYVEAHDGAENEVVVALERRLEIMGLLRQDFVDGKWDAQTTAAVKALQLSVNQEATGTLTPELVISITDIINTYKDMTYYEDTQLDTVLSRIY